MSINASLIEELRREAATTRRVLERVPEEHLSWRPHAKSMSLGQLAAHLAGLPDAIAQLVTELDVEVPNVPLREATDCASLLQTLDRSVDEAARRLSAWTDDDLRALWTLRGPNGPIFTVPRLGVIRSIMLNHSYHHRGQLTVYLRLLDVAVPSVYGPSADENPFA